MMVDQLQQAKLVLLGEMGSGKTSLVQRYVRGHYYENQVRAGRRRAAWRARGRAAPRRAREVPALAARARSARAAHLPPPPRL